MAKEGQTTSRLGSQSVLISVQEVGAVSDGDLETRVEAKRDWHTFPDWSLNPRKERGFVLQRWWQSSHQAIVARAGASCHRVMRECVHFKEAGCLAQREP